MDEILSIGGYDYISNPETGETSAVNPDTGEILPTVTLRMPANSQIISPKAAAAMADRIQRYKIYKENLERANQLGKFNFLSIDANFSALAPANVARLVYLSTYLPFNDSSLRFKNTRQLSNRNLPEVLGIEEKTSPLLLFRTYFDPRLTVTFGVSDFEEFIMYLNVHVPFTPLGKLHYLNESLSRLK